MKKDSHVTLNIILALALLILVMFFVNNSISKRSLNMETILPILLTLLGLLFFALLAMRVVKKDKDMGTRMKNPVRTLQYDLQQSDRTRKITVTSDPFGEFWGPTDTVIWVDGNYVGSIDNAKAAKEGREFRLDDGSLLKIKSGSALRGTPWIITLNEIPVLASLPNLLYRFKRVIAYQLVFSGLTIALGVMIEVWNPNYWFDLSHGLGYILWGSINAFLCIFISRRSFMSLTIALVFNVAASILVSTYPALYPGSPVWTSVIAIFSVFNLASGISPMRQLNKRLNKA